MKWNNPREGDRRTITRFLFLPRRIGYETRWLEWAKIIQEFCGFYGPNGRFYDSEDQR